MRWLLRCLLVAVWLLVPQVASAADPVPPAPTPTVPTPVPDPPAAATPDPAASVWLTRVPQVGNWMVDGVLGSLSAVLAVFNDLQAVVYRSVLGVFGDTTACGDLGFIACTPVNFFFATDSPVGAAVQEMWRILRSVATALLTLLLTVRIGRLMIGGVGDLASEGQELTTSFAMALAVIYGAEGLLRMLIGAFNDLHAAILGDGGAVILSAIESPVFFNLANQLLRALLFIVLFLLMFKAITRILHLALLIGMAPVMGALLLDRSTSSRFGAWFGRLIETLLQQTAWVFFLKVGSVLFASIQPVLTHDQLLGLLSDRKSVV